MRGARQVVVRCPPGNRDSGPSSNGGHQNDNVLALNALLDFVSGDSVRTIVRRTNLPARVVEALLRKGMRLYGLSGYPSLVRDVDR